MNSRTEPEYKYLVRAEIAKILEGSFIFEAADAVEKIIREQVAKENAK